MAKKPQKPEKPSSASPLVRHWVIPPKDRDLWVDYSHSRGDPRKNRLLPRLEPKKRPQTSGKSTSIRSSTDASQTSSSEAILVAPSATSAILEPKSSSNLSSAPASEANSDGSAKSKVGGSGFKITDILDTPPSKIDVPQPPPSLDPIEKLLADARKNSHEPIASKGDLQLDPATFQSSLMFAMSLVKPAVDIPPPTTLTPEPLTSSPSLARTNDPDSVSLLGVMVQKALLPKCSRIPHTTSLKELLRAPEGAAQWNAIALETRKKFFFLILGLQVENAAIIFNFDAELSAWLTTTSIIKDSFRDEVITDLLTYPSLANLWKNKAGMDMQNKYLQKDKPSQPLTIKLRFNK